MRLTSPTVLVATAHPDDETFSCGGTTALLARRGVAVHILLATRGQGGEIADPALDTPANRADLGTLREAEARAAAATLGAAGIAFLDHVDGRLGEVGDAVLAREVAEEIRRVRPDVVLTFGPEGVYGHPDHLAVHRAATLAFDLAADPAVELRGLAPHAAARLFYHVIPAAWAEQRNRDRGPIVINGTPLLFAGYEDDQITTRIDATAVAEVKLAALACHRSQTAGRMPQIRAMLTAGPLAEYYVLARARIPAAEGLSTDLLAGIAPR